MARKLTFVGLALAVVVTAALLGAAAMRQDGSQKREGAQPDQAAAGPSTQPTETKKEGTAMTAIRRAGAANRHVYLFLYTKNDEQTGNARKAFESTVSKMADKADRVAVDCSSSAEKDIVDKYGLDTAPMPLVLVFAPNGAITGGFPASQASEEKLQGAFASPGMQKCLKALQDRKLVLLCAQNGQTKSNSEAMAGVQAFKDDARFAQITEIVKVDPADAAEAGFMTKLKLDAKTDEATTLVLAPPGAVVAAFKGATSKDVLFAAIQKGCGAGGCGPGGCN